MRKLNRTKAGDHARCPTDSDSVSGVHEFCPGCLDCGSGCLDNLSGPPDGPSWCLDAPSRGAVTVVCSAEGLDGLDVLSGAH